jgi:hypothetical protein
LAVVMDVRVGHSSVRTLDRQARVEVLPELGAHDNRIAPQDEGGNRIRGIHVAEPDPSRTEPAGADYD